MNRPDDKTIERVLAGLADKDEARMVARWFATEEGSEYFSRHFYEDAESISPYDAELLINHKAPSEKILEKIFSEIRKKRIKRMMFRAAAVFLPFAVLLGMYLHLGSMVDLFGDSRYEEVYVPKGERVQMIFQDGTKVYINSDTYIKYPSKFGINNRKVELRGEAYFVVSSNKKRPFIVNLDGVSVNVLGTSFNVNAYPNDENITVNLDEGKINMRLATEEVPLSPGENIIYNKLTHIYKVNRVENPKDVSAWKNNVIVFKDEHIKDVFLKLERWYGVKFVTEDNIPSDILVTLTSQNTTIEKVLSDLEKITSLSFAYDEVSKEVNVKY